MTTEGCSASAFDLSTGQKESICSVEKQTTAVEILGTSPALKA